MSKKTLTRKLAAAAFLAALGGAIVSFAPTTMTSSIALAQGWTGQQATPAQQPPASATVRPGPDFSSIVERFGPAVVNVRVEGSARSTSDDDGPQFPGLPRDFGRRFG